MLPNKGHGADTTHAEYSGKLFTSASNIGIDGGTFTAAQQISYNNHYYHGPAGSGPLAGYGPSPFPRPQPVSDMRLSKQPNVHDITSQNGVQNLARSEGQLQQYNMVTGVPKSCDIYYRNLSAIGRGSPLWIPDPNDRLPIDYRRQGATIGDVGILTPSGAFDFLFNICRPLDHVFNKDRVPAGFIPLDPPLKEIEIHGYTEFKPDSYLTSPSIISYRDDNGLGMIFESSAPEGAILTMPHGARREDMRNIARLRKYMADNQESWYQHANGVLGCEVKDGDIHLVVGCDKAKSWRMAAFANVGPNDKFRLNFGPVYEGIGRKYGWEYNGIAQVQAGPDLQDVRELNDSSSPEIIHYRNQCLFIRTLNATLRCDHEDSTLSLCQSEPFGISEEAAQRQVEPQITASPNPMGEVAVVAETFHVLPSSITDPSEPLNSLFQQRPNARVAVTEDTDVTSVIRKNDVGLPNAQELILPVVEEGEVHESDGIVLLEPKKPEMTIRASQGSNISRSLKPDVLPLASKNVEIFNSSQSISIRNTSFTMMGDSATSGLQILEREIVRGARHDDAGQEEAPKCHPNTRRAILKGILDWVDEPRSDHQILWLEGPAGAGKTAIAGTVCEELKKKGRLGSDYFLSRNGRTSALLLFATIAYQLAVAIPAVRKSIDQVVADDPSIIFKSAKTQLFYLVVNPLLILDRNTPPFIIVIDGLDECENESKKRRESEDLQRHIIQLIGSVCKDYQLPVRFMVASRPERWIDAEFASESVACTLRRVSLEQTAATDQDIRTYYKSEFQKIPLRWDDPESTLLMSLSEQDLNTLVDKASGQFIYPTTLFKFLSDPGGLPIDRLRTILAVPVVAITPNPFADPDLLFTQILSMAPDHKRIMDLLGALLVVSSTLDSDPILVRESLFIAEGLLGLGPGEGYVSLHTLHSLLHVPRLENSRETMSVDEYRTWLAQGPGVKFHHKSFPAFLGDKTRSYRQCNKLSHDSCDKLCSFDFFVDNNLVHSRLALGCLKVLKGLSSQPESRRLHYVTWDYALLFWCTHCSNSGTLNSESELADALKRLDLYLCYTVVFQKTHQRTAPSAALDKIQKKLTSQMNWVRRKDAVLFRDKVAKDAGPDPRDIFQAMDFIASLGGGFIFRNRIRALCNLRTWLMSQPKPGSRLLAELNIIINGIDPNVLKQKEEAS